jgi:hypothetical protein
MVLLDAALQLVAWGWQPGAGRDPAPGSLALLGELVQAWIDTGGADLVREALKRAIPLFEH